MQPWVELSQKHKEAWDTSLWDCMSTLLNIIHKHHTEQLGRVEQQITSHTSTITRQYPKDVSKPILDFATTHHPQQKHKPCHKPHHKPIKKPPIQPSSTPSITPSTTPLTQPPCKRAKTNGPKQQHQGCRTRQHRPNQTQPPNPLPPPQPVSNVTRDTICRRLVGNQSKFPIIYGMFMKEGP